MPLWKAPEEECPLTATRESAPVGARGVPSLAVRLARQARSRRPSPGPPRRPPCHRPGCLPGRLPPLGSAALRSHPARPAAGRSGHTGPTCDFAVRPSARPEDAPTHVALQLPLGGRLDEPARAHGVARTHRGRRRRRFLQLGRRGRRKSGRGCRRGGPSAARPAPPRAPVATPAPGRRGPLAGGGRRHRPWPRRREKRAARPGKPLRASAPLRPAPGLREPKPRTRTCEGPGEEGKPAGLPSDFPAPLDCLPRNGSRTPLPQRSLYFSDKLGCRAIQMTSGTQSIPIQKVTTWRCCLQSPCLQGFQSLGLTMVVPHGSLSTLNNTNNNNELTFTELTVMN